MPVHFHVLEDLVNVSMGCASCRTMQGSSPGADAAHGFPVRRCQERREERKTPGWFGK